MRKQLISTVESLLEEDNKIVLLLGDIGVFGFRNSFKMYPDRVYNIGILEQTTVGLASGLAMLDLVPIVHTIAPFLVERSLEQLKIDFGYQKLNGNFVSIGNSYDYSALGPTHHCPGDVQILLTIPNMQIVLPGTSEEFNQLFKQSYKNGSPTYFRLSEFENNQSYDVNFGFANVIKTGTDATIVCVGNMLQTTIDATEGLDVTILYYTSINPFDEKTLKDNFNENLIIIEPYYEGGINYLINKTLISKKMRILNIGVPLNFIENYGTKKENDISIGLDSESIKKQIINFINI
jgi:transketolase